MISVKNIEKSFGEKKVLHRVNLSLPEGKVTALMGVSGSGKTTLLRILMGLEKADSGEILGTEGKKLSVVFQEDRLLEHLTADGNLRFVGGADTAALLAALGLAEENQPVSAFSGGMKRRVAIARALAIPFDILLLDEPFRGLDENTKQKTIDTVKRYSTGKTVLLITHDEAEAMALDAEIVSLANKI